MHRAAAVHCTSEMSKLMAEGHSINESIDNQTPLFLAIGDEQVVRWMLEQKAEPNQIWRGMTPLIAKIVTTDKGSDRDAIPVIQTLLKFKADPTLGEPNALQVAKCLERKDVLAVLQEAQRDKMRILIVPSTTDVIDQSNKTMDEKTETPS